MVGGGRRRLAGDGGGRCELRWVHAPLRNRSAPREVTQGRLAVETGGPVTGAPTAADCGRRGGSSAMVVQRGSTKISA
jgi:hypothetical protein